MGTRRIYGAVVGLVAFFIPCVALILFILMVRGFLPSDRLLTWSIITTPVAVVLILSVIGPLLAKAISADLTERRTRKAIGHVALLLFTPIFVAFLWHFFLVGPFSYAMHSLEPPSTASLREKVSYAYFGTRTCGNMATLQGNTFLLPKQLCGLTSEAVDALRSGGTIQLEGLMSRYGFEVQRYRYDNAG